MNIHGYKKKLQSIKNILRREESKDKPSAPKIRRLELAKERILRKLKALKAKKK